MKKLLLLSATPLPFILGLVFLVVMNVMALTPAERKMVQTIQGQVEEGQRDYEDARSHIALADQRASTAEQHAADTDKEIGTVRGQIKTANDKADSLQKENNKMKPVYDKVNSGWGLGAFEYGFHILFRNLLITAVVVLAVIAILYGLSFAFPVLGAGLSVGLRVFRRFFSSVSTTIGNIVRRIEAHLKPKPTPVVLES